MTRASIRQQLVEWLSQGITPRRLALTLALGCAIGCIPVVGVPTLLCAGLALALRLNQPAIQAANYAVMPAQIGLIVPFVRLGGWLFSSPNQPQLSAAQLLHTPPLHLAGGLGVLAAEALAAWVVVAIPVVALMTLALTLVLRRIPAIAAFEVAD
jgi:uncharacterized protein (DUF2062 family)